MIKTLPVVFLCLTAKLFVHLQEQFGISQHTLEIHRPDKILIRYNVKLGDEPILAPMALFRPMALGLIGEHLIRMQARSDGDSEDPHDEDYLRQTQRQSWVSLWFHVSEYAMLVIVLACKKECSVKLVIYQNLKPFQRYL